MKKKIAIYANGWGADNVALFIRGIEYYLADKNSDLFTFLSYGFYSMSKGDEDAENKVFDIVDADRFDGAIVFSNGLNSTSEAERIVARAVKAGVPVVSLGIHFPGASFVNVNSYIGMRELSQHLVYEHKVRDVVYLAGNEGNPDSESRLGALSEVLEEVGGKVRTIHYTNWATDRTVEIIDEFYSSKDKLPDAFVCANDYIALAACSELENVGINVPDDVLVTGFDGIKDGKTFYPSISTVVQDYFAQGEACAEIILKKIEEHSTAPTERLIASRFLPGESCGCMDSRNSRLERDNACRKNYFARTEKVFFDGHLTNMENALFSCAHATAIARTMTGFYKADHFVEGGTFAVLGESSYAASIYNDEVSLTRGSFSDHLKPVVALYDGVDLDIDTFCRNDLVPGYKESDKLRNFFYVAIHSDEVLYGYFIIENVIARIEDFTLEVYRRSFRDSLDKFRQNMRLEYLNQKLMELYTRDSLTGLYNRFGYETLAIPMFKEAHAKNKSLAVVFVDINRMKHINDNFGHLQGDLAIRTIANAILQQAPESWIAIRYGGDEYLIIGECDDENEVKELVAHMEEGIKKQVRRMSLPFELSASCGYIMTDPTSSLTLAEYIKQADDVMYEHKKQSYEAEGYKR
ncbi:diguanylate cyclase (GGDEF) domain-containing protein [Lachnospiraceae bacterium YSD2013]|nr:diguanylate cyclase (GGDEF) domain-containing protein [Lachnospiraceae bacterium YSD2013]